MSLHNDSISLYSNNTGFQILGPRKKAVIIACLTVLIVSYEYVISSKVI